MASWIEELKRVEREHHKNWSDIFAEYKQAREDLTSVKKTGKGYPLRHGDLEGVRRLLPLASGDITVVPPMEWECLEEEAITALLVRTDVERCATEV